MAIFTARNRPLLALLAICGTSTALADVIYQQDFENWTNADGLWSTNNRSDLGGVYTSVLGRFGTQTASLNILATPDNSTGNNGGNPGGNQFNITTQQFNNTHVRHPYPDSSPGGGQGNPGNNNPPGDIPSLNLGDAISGGSNPGTPIFAAGTYAIEFDMMLFDSWDGDHPLWGNDTFAINVNGQTIFDEVFYSYTDNTTAWTPDELPTTNVFNSVFADKIFRDIRVTFEIANPIDALAIDFIGQINQDINDESWGIDNLQIEYLSPLMNNASTPAIPAPGSLIILGSSIGLLSRRRRQ